MLQVHSGNVVKSKVYTFKLLVTLADYGSDDLFQFLTMDTLNSAFKLLYSVGL